MSSYRVYCNECDEEFLVEVISKKQPEHCCICGSEVIYGDVVNTSRDEDLDDEAAWDRISRESLDDIDDWKINE